MFVSLLIWIFFFEILIDAHNAIVKLTWFHVNNVKGGQLRKLLDHLIIYFLFLVLSIVWPHFC